MITINLLKYGNEKQQRMFLYDCLNLMWEEFREIVPYKDHAKIRRFLVAKDMAQRILASEVRKKD